MTIDQSLRDRISSAISNALRPLPAVFAGWEGGSAAFGAVDACSDIDLNYLVDDDASTDVLYTSAENALKMVSPITARHTAPPGRYYKLRDGGEFLFVDLCFFRAAAPDHYLDVERHGHIVPLFDKGDWLSRKFLDQDALSGRRDQRYRELQTWFPVSQSFVRKAILRCDQVEAVTRTGATQ